MKNLVLTFLLALLVVLTAMSLRRVVGNVTTTVDSPAFVAIGTSPVPPWPPPPPPPPPPSK